MQRSPRTSTGILGFATADQRDQLQEIKGVGPFIEEKLNALGIYTFAQISKNELRPGGHNKRGDRVLPRSDKRDEWAKQARAMVGKKDPEEGPSQDPDDAVIGQNDLIEQAREEIRRNEEEEEEKEIERRKEKAAELLSRVTSERTNEGGKKMIRESTSRSSVSDRRKIRTTSSR